jgi:hypothetical protein
MKSVRCNEWFLIARRAGTRAPALPNGLEMKGSYSDNCHESRGGFEKIRWIAGCRPCAPFVFSYGALE